MKIKPCLPAVCLAVAILVAGCAFAGAPAEDPPAKGDPPVSSPAPDTPDTPDGPDTPVVPDTPDTPDTPDDPGTPDVPVAPDTPDEPDAPDTPENPDTPETPENPVTPDTPDIPDTPDAPEDPPEGDPGDVPDIPDTVNPADTPGTITPWPDDAGDEPAGPAGLRGARPSSSGALSVEGTRLVDESGGAVQLRGISTHGLAWFPQFVNEDCFRQLSEEWGVNAVRLALYTAEYGGWCSGGDREALLKLVTDGVEYAARADMYVIVDWHILSDGDPNTHAAEAAEFFGTVTERLKDYGNVLYEICNEPNGGATWGDIKAYAEKIIPVIRENAPEAVILVGTPNWSQRVDEAARDPLSGYENILYTLHFYAGTHRQELRDAMAAAIGAGLPVFVSEYGICDASGNGALDTAEAQKWVDAMNGEGVSYMLWNLSNKAESSSVLAASCRKTSGFTDADLSECGRWFKEMLASDPAVPAVPAPEPETEPAPEPQPPTGPEIQPGLEGPSVNPPEITGGEGDVAWTLAEANSWQGADGRYVQYVLAVRNTGAARIDTWRVELTLDGPFELQSSWNGVFAASGAALTVTPADYNAALAPNAQAADIGFIVRYTGQ